ncbi:MAG: type II toxin-antitoxin system RelE/ParE family toxin [Nitrospinae bacterium]|nr:type II toxin-antitoxin system RelE/ParE family toxin [Nitrospinota bacterium]
MIVNFLPRGLKRPFLKGDGGAFPVHPVSILEDIPSRLDTAQDIRAMNLPAYHLHQLTGKDKGFWSVTVSVNCRVVFKLQDGRASDADYLDYHGKQLGGGLRS